MRVGESQILAVSLLLGFECMRWSFVSLQCAMWSVLEDATLRVVESVTDRAM